MGSVECDMRVGGDGFGPEWIVEEVRRGGERRRG